MLDQIKAWPDWVKSLLATVSGVVASAVFFAGPAQPPQDLNAGIAYAVCTGVLAVLVIADYSSKQAHDVFARQGFMLTIVLGVLWLAAIAPYYVTHHGYVANIYGSGDNVTRVTVSRTLSKTGIEYVATMQYPECAAGTEVATRQVGRRCAQHLADETGKDYAPMFDESSVETNGYILFASFLTAAMSFSLLLTFALLRGVGANPHKR